MKKITIFLSLLLFIVFTNYMAAQPWTDNLPQEKLQKGNLTFYEIQKAFNDYWTPLNVNNGYYKNDKGEETKAFGWKQFKRWEWHMEKRIVKETGEFPKTSAGEEFAKYLSENPETDSPAGNWTSLGPTSSPGGYAGLGRLNCVGFISGDNNTLYVGSPSGGIWKTSDGGTNWTPLGDQNAVLGVSDIVAYRPVSSPDVIYIATGDKNGGSMWSLGGGQYNDNNSVGVLKSTDGGTTWNATGLSFTANQYRRVYRLLIHPSNNSLLYAATSVGVYKTINGGTSWTLLTATEFGDMEFNPGNPSIICASTRTGDIYRSVNDGSTWAATLSTAHYRTEIAVSPNNAAIVYAVVSDVNDGLAAIYKSTDNGATFSPVFLGTTINILHNQCSTNATGGQAGYDLCIATDPTNANTVFVGGVNTWRSTNGGTSWTMSSHWAGDCGVQEVHADKHFMAYQNGASTLFECNDGGIYKTTNSGALWTYIGSGLITSQLYRLGVAQTVANENIIGLQDNGTKAFLSGSWSDVLGGDGMDCAIDYTNQNTLYGEFQNGALRRSTNHGVNWSSITAGLTGSPSWVSPFAIDPNVNTTVYFGYQDVFKSTNQGTTWTKISTWGGSNILTITVASSNSSYIYAATSSILYRTTNGGTSWTNITGTIPTASGDITSVCVKNNDPNTAWVTLGNYSSNRVYQTTNGGSTWASISTGLPALPVMNIIQNKQNTGQVELYVGTDLGVYVKVGAANWTLFSTGLPNVVVNELEIYYNASPSLSRIRAATSGRGLWQSDLYSTGASAPVADFSASNTNPFINAQVNFTDLSSNTPTSWSWSFAPATVTYLNGTTSTSQNPQVKFTATGLYSVTLTATNGYGSDPETKTNYINVTNCTVTSFPWNEGFENGGLIPTCWTQEQVNGSGINWDFVTGNGGIHPAAAHSGTYNARLMDATAADNKTRLITPALNLTTLCSAQLKFWHTQELWSPDQDQLTVFYKTSAGGSWIQLVSYTSNFATWTLEAIPLPNPTSDYYIAFEGNAKYGWGVCIDDVQVGDGPVSAFPWNEGFENGGAIPACWSQEQVNASGVNWTFRNGSVYGNPSTAHSGTYNANLFVEATGDHKTKLITPPLNLTAVTTPQLKFWHTQTYWAPDQDQLTVFYKTSAGGTWTQLATYTSDISTWTQETLALPGKTGDYYIAFEGNAKYGYGVCIDDVRVSDGLIPDNFNAQNVTISALANVCYNAQQTITLAGGGTTFAVQGAGSITMIAGQNIRFLPGASVAWGGYLHGYIAPTGPWCYIPPVPASPLTGTNPVITDKEQEFYKVYPNPTTGSFTLELGEASQNSAVKVEIYGMQGDKILNYNFTGENKHVFTLDGKPSGIYFMRVFSGEQTGVVKIIKE
ncbi:MAG: choice-of-anchor J domain-containing protein [Bacteroidales bacterium]|nr:choice-of-anchor J domain-containing protein [Bacteroidales bacterium]